MSNVLKINFNNFFGSRYVGKYVPGYFPVTVHVEDARAFDRNKAYGEVYYFFPKPRSYAFICICFASVERKIENNIMFYGVSFFIFHNMIFLCLYYTMISI